LRRGSTRHTRLVFSSSPPTQSNATGLETVGATRRYHVRWNAARKLRSAELLPPSFESLRGRFAYVHGYRILEVACRNSARARVRTITAIAHLQARNAGGGQGAVCIRRQWRRRQSNALRGLIAVAKPSEKALGSFVWYLRSLHIPLSHRATDFGSKRTQVPMRKDGIRPAFACLKIVILETVNMLASSSAVKARSIRSILSGSDIGSAELFWGLHDRIYLLCGFTFAATAAYCCRTVLHATPVRSLKALS
jgi:hypothetical protein